MNFIHMIKIAYSLTNPAALPCVKAINFEISRIYHDVPLLLQQKQRAMVVLDPLSQQSSVGLADLTDRSALSKPAPLASVGAMASTVCPRDP